MVALHPLRLAHAAVVQFIHFLLEVLIGCQTGVVGIAFRLGNIALLFLDGLLFLLSIPIVGFLNLLEVSLLAFQQLGVVGRLQGDLQGFELLF